MSSVSSRDFFDELLNLDRDPRTSPWWSTGISVLSAVMIVYTTATCWLQNCNPTSSQPRGALRLFKVAYNALTALLNGILATSLLWAYHSSERSYVCQDRDLKNDKESEHLLHLMWFVFVLRSVSSMVDALVSLVSLKEARIKNAFVLNGYISAVFLWFYLRYGSDGHGVPSVIVFCVVDSVTHAYHLIGQFRLVDEELYRSQRIHVTRIQLLGTAIAWAHYFVALIAECRFPTILALVGFSYAGMRFVRLFDFYTEKFVLNGMRLGLDWAIIAGILENCCFAQGNPNGQQDEDDDGDYGYTESSSKTNSSTAFRNGFSGPIKPKRG